MISFNAHKLLMREHCCLYHFTEEELESGEIKLPGGEVSVWGVQLSKAPALGPMLP